MIGTLLPSQVGGPLANPTLQPNVKRTFLFPGLKLEGSVSPHEPVVCITTAIQGKSGFDHSESIEGSFKGEISGNDEVLFSLPLPLQSVMRFPLSTQTWVPLRGQVHLCWTRTPLSYWFLTLGCQDGHILSPNSGFKVQVLRFLSGGLKDGQSCLSPLLNFSKHLDLGPVGTHCVPRAQPTVTTSEELSEWELSLCMKGGRWRCFLPPWKFCLRIDLRKRFEVATPYFTVWVNFSTKKLCGVFLCKCCIVK